MTEFTEEENEDIENDPYLYEEEEEGDVESFLINRRDIVLDIILIEQDRINNLRIKELDLYYKDPITEEMRLVGEAYRGDVEQIKKNIFKKRKMRYFITFSETHAMEDGLIPSALKVARYMARVMSYDNRVKGYSMRDFSNHLNSHSIYINKAIKELLDKNVIKYEVYKNRRTYMVNPVYYYRGSLSKLFQVTYHYSKFGVEQKEEDNPFSLD